jgi:hypothetical protein
MAAGAISSIGAPVEEPTNPSGHTMTSLNKVGKIYQEVLKNSLTEASNEAITEVVIDHRLDIDNVADRALHGAAGGLVSTSVTEFLTPEELRKQIISKMAETVDGFNQAITEQR